MSARRTINCTKKKENEMYFLNGKKVDLEKAIMLYNDGRYSNRSVYYYKTKTGKYLVEHCSKWQGDHDYLEEITEKEFIERMVASDHPDRATEALNKAGLFDKIEEFE